MALPRLDIAQAKALKAMEELAKQNMLQGMTYTWSRTCARRSGGQR